ncbi:MAG: thymidine kinase [Clostridia bacterium]|nr:thymidine kinase [Clostridia bacterium]
MAKLYFRYGAMNCGKTTLLLQTAHNYEERGMNVIIFKPQIDTKGDNKIVSRLGITRDIDYLLTNEDEISNYLNKNELPAAIIVDEAQFLTTKQVDELYVISKELNIPVLTYGLRNDFLMNTFEGAARLLALADSIEELKTICRCGRKATQNMRFLNGKPVFKGESILIDGTSNIVYESVCGKCYLEKRGIIK